MEIGNKLLVLRKNKGFSQEELAEKLNISRQTISKWELNESSPDIQQAKQLSKIYKISIDELVDNDIKDILTEKISNTERLAGLTIKILKIFGVIALALFIILGTHKMFFTRYVWITGGSESLNCSLKDKNYSYTIIWENEAIDYNKPSSDKSIEKLKIVNIERQEGSDYLGSIIDLEKYEYYWQLKEAVYGYFEKNGGTC